MIELEPEHTARCILASTLLLYSPAAILLPYQQVTSGNNDQIKVVELGIAI